jgi:hypothetical protein
VGKITVGSLVAKNAPLGTQVTIGSIDLVPGTWIILANIWNPAELGMSPISLGIEELGFGTLATSQLTQVIAFATLTVKASYHVVYTQWSKESVVVRDGTIIALRIA